MVTMKIPVTTARATGGRCSALGGCRRPGLPARRDEHDDEPKGAGGTVGSDWRARSLRGCR